MIRKHFLFAICGLQASADALCDAPQVPVLLALVYVALWLHSKLKWALPQPSEAEAPTPVKADAQKA